MSDSAILVHSAAGRARFKIPARKGDERYFATLEEQFYQLSGVSQVTCNPAIASVLILHDGVAPDALHVFAAERGLFEPENSRGGETLWEFASSGLTALDRRLQSYTDGHMDMRSVLLLVLLFLMARQFWRGSVAAPAASLLWYVFQLLSNTKK